MNDWRARREELQLARACVQGSAVAWENLVQRYRQKLYAAAFTLTREWSAARELVDSFYTDLYGVSAAGKRVSRLAGYHGRGPLESWLKASLVQAYVDRYRSQRRLVRLEEHAALCESVQTGDLLGEHVADPRVEEALAASVLKLTPEDRLILASYYFDNRTMAQIARIFGVHESTISRKIDRISKHLRQRITLHLRSRGVHPHAIEEFMQAAPRELYLDLRALILHGIEMVRG